MISLTDRQKTILDFLKSFLNENGYPPTVRDIGTHFNIQWAAAKNHLKALETKGYVRINQYKSRGIEILGLKHTGGFLSPVVGNIRAGSPVLAVEDISSHILLDKFLFPSERAFTLRVSGDSMIEAGILDGDFIVVNPQIDLHTGEIGVVLIEGEATVKRVYMSDGKVTLKPENRSMEPITYCSESISIIGKVIGVIRRI
ncbi:MAG: transcriptional repressor LexA [Dissulfurispiraceae bacterium]|jgi:repressor LexA